MSKQKICVGIVFTDSRNRLQSATIEQVPLGEIYVPVHLLLLFVSPKVSLLILYILIPAEKHSQKKEPLSVHGTFL